MIENDTQMSVPTREQGYSAKETKLIQELVKARLEQKAELQHESLDGYELPPRTQFSMLKKPALTMKHGRMKFNMPASTYLKAFSTFYLSSIGRRSGSP